MDSPNKRIATGRKTIYEILHKDSDIIKLGIVVSNIDPNYLGRIKVRIKAPRNKGGDDGISDKDLPWAQPLIPKFLATQPKVGEAVYIFVFNQDKQNIDRMYVGPIISQPQQLFNDPYYVTALGGFTFGSEEPNVSVATIPQLDGVFPDPADVSIQGRYNTDITQKYNEVVIRAGKFVSTSNDTNKNNNPFKFKYNATTQAYIQIKNDVSLSTENIQSKTSIVSTQPSSTIFETEERGSITNIVANKINLLTHSGGSPKFDLTNQINLISDEEMANILKTAHPLVFGDELLKYLRLLKNALINHVHNGNGNPATDLITGGRQLDVAEFVKQSSDLENKMLSKNIRIN